MKIQPIIGAGYASKVFGKSGKAAAAYAGQSSKPDEVSFSKEGLTFSRALNAAKEAAGATSLTEQSRISEVKNQIADGSYKIDSKLIAGKILDRVV